MAIFGQTVLVGLSLLLGIQSFAYEGAWWVVIVPFSFLPFLLFLIARNLHRYARTPALELNDDCLHDYSLLHPLRIPFENITEVRDFSDCLEIVYILAESPGLWRLTPELLSPDHRASLASKLKCRVRASNPSARIYDEHTGPPEGIHPASK